MRNLARIFSSKPLFKKFLGHEIFSSNLNFKMENIICFTNYCQDKRNLKF